VTRDPLDMGCMNLVLQNKNMEQNGQFKFIEQP